ncbi:MAG TPA: hypothetical protein VHZ78_06695 [Rhizomicrobium sp.]|nr:hypothetical protein [Rhizomicrobium sp.]
MFASFETGLRRCVVVFGPVAALFLSAAGPAAPAAPDSPPVNMHINLSNLDLKRDQVPDGVHYMATGPAQAYDKKSHDVGWYSHDLVMGKKTPTLHYGAFNRATYAYGVTDIPGSRGQFWTPAFAINSKAACTVSFVHSYALGDASRMAPGVDQMMFRYRLDSQAWVDQAMPKPSVKINWTTVTVNIPCQGHSKLQLSWDFNTVDGEHNTGRGWNLKSFDLKQG